MSPTPCLCSCCIRAAWCTPSYISIDVDAEDSPLRKLEGLNQRPVAEMWFDQWLDLAHTFAFCLVAPFLELLHPPFLVVEHPGAAVVGDVELVALVGVVLTVQLYRGQRAVYGQSWAGTAWKVARLVVGERVALLAALLGVLVKMAV